MAMLQNDMDRLEKSRFIIYLMEIKYVTCSMPKR